MNSTFSFRGVIVYCLLLSFFLSGVPFAQAQITSGEKLSGMRAECAAQMFEELQEERNIYRGVQFGEHQNSVLGTAAETTDLVPYLVLNYNGLACRLRYICDAIGSSHGDDGMGTVLSYRPVGCSRMFAARGRWWSADRRDWVFRTEAFDECAYHRYDEPGSGFVPTAYYSTIELQCDEWVDQILEEERQMLRLLTAQDSINRGARRTVTLFHAVLSTIRSSFLMPLRDMVSLFGSTIYPIPCLLSQCN